jgi:hypothetical protein
MGLFDYVTVNDPCFVCSNGHDLSAEEFQSKDFGCTMGRVVIENERVSSHDGYFGKPEADSKTVEIYCTCRQCPAFVQFGTGNLIGCDVTFEIELDGSAVKLVTRTSPATNDWLRDESLKRHMKRCEGPMPYRDAELLHVHYRKRRVEQHAEFDKWATARAHALQAGKSWPLSLRVGEYPDSDGEEP